MADVDTKVLEALQEKFDDRLLKSRKIYTPQGAKWFKYIPEPLVRDRLVQTLGLDWDFVIKSSEILPFNNEVERVTKHQQVRDPREHKQVVVQGSGIYLNHLAP
jgi:hypothetical protein